MDGQKTNQENKGVITRENIERFIKPELQVKLVADISHRNPIDEEEDFFELGLARTHGLVKPNSLELTDKGIEELIRILEETHAEMQGSNSEAV